MDELVKQLPIAGPLGVALVIVIVAFLRHLDKMTMANRAEREEMADRNDVLIAKHLHDTTGAIKDLTVTTAGLSRAIDGMNQSCAETRRAMLHARRE